MDCKTLTLQLEYTAYVLRKNVEGISHEESLKNFPPEGNSLNWVVGHVVNARNRALALAGQEAPLSEDRYAPYATGDDWGPSTAIPFEELLADFERLQEPLKKALLSISPEALAEPASLIPTRDPSGTVGSLLTGIVFHEAYHAGQMGLLRRLLGKPGGIGAPK
jgi:hypothetical protein